MDKSLANDFSKEKVLGRLIEKMERVMSSLLSINYDDSDLKSLLWEIKNLNFLII